MLISNIVRNASLHMAIPLDFVNNTAIESAIYKLHKILGLDINDVRTTMDTDWEHPDFAKRLPAGTIKRLPKVKK